MKKYLLIGLSVCLLGACKKESKSSSDSGGSGGGGGGKAKELVKTAGDIPFKKYTCEGTKVEDNSRENFILAGDRDTNPTKLFAWVQNGDKYKLDMSDSSSTFVINNANVEAVEGRSVSGTQKGKDGDKEYKYVIELYLLIGANGAGSVSYSAISDDQDINNRLPKNTQYLTLNCR